MSRRTAIEWLDKLVSFDNTSRNESNMNIVNYLKDYFESVGVKCTLQFDATKKKANIFATIPGADGVRNGGIILSGHLDTVPVDGQNWTSNPYKLTDKGDGKLYGRGTCDMKGFIAVCMSLVPEFLSMKRTNPIHFAWTYDEEVGCLGGRELTKLLKEQGLKADGCLVGEPTDNKVVVAHKGICVWNVTVRGRAAHSSYALTSDSCNAIDYAARLIVKIRDIAEDVKVNTVNDKFFDVPFTTMSTNQISGGIAMNTVPAECKFVYEFRNIPETQQDDIQKRVSDYVESDLLPRMKKEFDGAEIIFNNTARVPPLPSLSDTDPFVVLVRGLTGDNKPYKLGGATEAGQYSLIGVPVVICGPGSINVAHKVDEFVPIKDLEDSEKLVLNLIKKNQLSGAHV